MITYLISPIYSLYIQPMKTIRIFTIQVWKFKVYFSELWIIKLQVSHISQVLKCNFLFLALFYTVTNCLVNYKAWKPSGSSTTLVLHCKNFRDISYLVI